MKKIVNGVRIEMSPEEVRKMDEEFKRLSLPEDPMKKIQAQLDEILSMVRKIAGGTE